MNKNKPLCIHDLFANWQVLSSWEPPPNSPLSYSPVHWSSKSSCSSRCLHPSLSLTWTNSLAFAYRPGCGQKTETTLSISNRGELSAENQWHGCISSVLRSKRGMGQHGDEQQQEAAAYPAAEGTQRVGSGEDAVMEPWSQVPAVELNPQAACSVRTGAGQYHRGRDCVIEAGTITRRRCSPASGTPQKYPGFSPTPTLQPSTIGQIHLGTKDKDAWEMGPCDIEKDRKWIWPPTGTWPAQPPLAFNQSSLHTAWAISLEHCCSDVTSNSSVVPSMMATMTSERSTLELHASSSLLPNYLVKTSNVTKTIPVVFNLCISPTQFLSLQLGPMFSSSAYLQCLTQCLTIKNV